MPRRRRLELVDQLHGPDLRSAGEGAGRIAGGQDVDGVETGTHLADDRGDDVHDVREALDRAELDHPHGARLAHPAEIVAAEVDEHQVLGALLLAADQFGGELGVLGVGAPARSRAGDRMQAGDGPGGAAVARAGHRHQ